MKAAIYARRVRRVLAELNHANRRMLEIKTGVAFTRSDPRPLRGAIAELEHAYQATELD